MKIVHGQRTARVLLLAAGACGGPLMAPGCGGAGGRHRADDVNVSLADLVQETGGEPAATLGEAAHQPADGEELESLVSEHAAALEQAFGNPAQPSEHGYSAPPADPSPEPAREDVPAVSLADMAADAEATPAETTDEPAAVEETPQPQPLSPEAQVDALYGQLQQALGEEIRSTSEPFRSAVALVALAAAQGGDPLAAIGPDTSAGSRLSPAERESVETVAQLLGTLLAPESADESRRAEVFQRLAGRLTQDFGLRVPTASLCTRVRGFGKYEPFSKTDFLAGRPIRALVYAEVDGFDHREMDFSGFGAVEVQDKWSVELSEELQLYHVADGRLAWRRPAEKVVETSRNRQRDFYLLAEIELPRTLTVGSYELKVIIKDDVSGAVAEKIIPIGVVADPALAWSAD